MSLSERGSQTEEVTSRTCGDGGNFCEADATKVSNLLCYQGNVGTFVALAAMGNGSEVRGIGLKKESFERDCFGDFRHGGILEGYHSTDTKMESHLQCTLRLLYTAAEAVHHSLP